MRKAYEEAQAGTTVVLLIPARTDTAYFHDYIYGKAEIRFLRGRLHFEDEDGNRFPPAPFPSIGEMRLQRVVDCANEISAKFSLEKQVRGEERAKATLEAAVWWFMPPFLLPALSAPKTEREAVQLAARREAADTVMKIYVQAMHKALGFGADRVAVVAAETEGNFRQFGECTKDGEYYGYAVLARKIGQIIHDTVEVDTSGATEPVFGKTLF